MWCSPWRKYRIEIHSDVVSRLMKNGQKSNRLNPINSQTSIRMNPKPSFQSRFIRINPISDWSKPNSQSEPIWIIPTLDSFGLILIENAVWISSKSDWSGLKTWFRIGSDSFGLFIPNQSEKRFVSRLMKNGQKLIRLNTINFETSIRTNPKPSFQSRSIRINPISDWSKPNSQSEPIWIIPTLNWVWLIFDRFSSNDIQNVFRIGLEWFALARIQILEWNGIVLIDLEWISIRYFRQGSYNWQCKQNHVNDF